jgi:hypothetical protein
MIKRIFEWLISPMGRVGVLIAVLSVFSVAVYGIYTTQQSPEQPIEFRHDVHVKLGVQCLYCHPGALRGPSPGLPTQSKCWGCHQQIAKTFTSDRLAVLVEYVERNEPIVWIPVAQVPDFVHFTHRPHIAAGLNCESCHGDLSEMEIYENPQVLNMGWCLSCHNSRTEDNVQNNPENDPHVSELLHEKRTKLTDCGTCHY